LSIFHNSHVISVLNCLIVPHHSLSIHPVQIAHFPEQINADLNVLRIKREAVDAEVEVKVADEDAKNVPHDLNISVDKNDIQLG
jgi:hypothetical protein